MFVTVAVIASAALLAAGLVVGHVRSRLELRRTRADLAEALWSAEHDPLTGLPNRVGAQRHHGRQVAAGRRLAMVLLDLDEFKVVNDTWGHQVGDAHLTAVAERLADACVPIGAVASRLAGDEFLLLIPHPGPAGTSVLTHVKTVLAGLGTPLTLRGDSGPAVTTTPRASAGIALPEAGSTWADLLLRADIALYHAKTRKGCAMLHARGMCHPAPAMTGRGPRLREHAATVRRLSAVGL